MRKIIIITTALILVLLTPFIIRIVSNGYDDSAWNQIGENSLDGTYEGSDGWISATVEIFGDSWYGSVSFGPYGETKTESGRVEGNILYSGWIEVGRVSGRTLTYGRATLFKQ